MSKPYLLKCPKCNTQIHIWHYLGANPNHNKHYYKCPKCGTIIIEEEKR